MQQLPRRVPDSGKFSNWLRVIRNWLKRDPDPTDPCIGVRVPLRKGPGGRRGEAAARPPDDSNF